MFRADGQPGQLCNRTPIIRPLYNLNAQNPSIQFTMEEESEERVSFLDVMVERGGDSKITTTIYRKPTHTDRYLH